MQALFSETEINGMVLSNRFVRSATWSAMAAEDGRCTSQLVNLMVTLADGGTGLIITGHAYVRKDGQAGVNQLGVYSDDHIAGLRDMVKKVHDHGGKIVLQISHAGLFANQKLTGIIPIAPSVLEGIVRAPRREMDHGDMKDLIYAFGAAAMRAREAGFDGVQMHSAHGYLLSQFLSPVYNRRKDDYGGSIQNRARFPLEVLGAIRKVVGRDYPVLAKLNCGDFVEDGLTTDDAVQAGRMLVEAGLDALEISGGLLTGGRMSPSRMVKNTEQEAYFKNEARAFRKALDIPLILVGGIRSFETAERLVNDGTVDLVSMSRPLIREPDLVNRWKSGDTRKALCRSDNACFKPGMEGKGIYCVTAETEKLEKNPAA